MLARLKTRHFWCGSMSVACVRARKRKRRVDLGCESPHKEAKHKTIDEETEPSGASTLELADVLSGVHNRIFDEKRAGESEGVKKGTRERERG